MSVNALLAGPAASVADPNASTSSADHASASVSIGAAAASVSSESPLHAASVAIAIVQAVVSAAVVRLICPTLRPRAPSVGATSRQHSAKTAVSHQHSALDGAGADGQPMSMVARRGTAEKATHSDAHATPIAPTTSAG